LFIRLPDGAQDDFFRVVSQGSRELSPEVVGRYRDKGDVQYYQDRSGLLSESPPDRDDLDKSRARWYVTPVAATPTIVDGETIDVRGGARQFEIFDGRTIGSGVDNSISHAYEPIWANGVLPSPNDNCVSTANPGDPSGRICTVPAGFTDATLPHVGFDPNGTLVMAQDGFLADSADVSNPTLVNTRTGNYVGIERMVNFSVLRYGPFLVEFSGGWWIPPGSFGWRPGPSRLTAGDPGLNVNQDLINRGYDLQHDIVRYEFNARVAEYEMGSASSSFCFGGCATWSVYGLADYGYNVYFKRYEDFKDYTYQWTGKWHDVADRRNELSFQWVTKSEDVFGIQPSYVTHAVTRPVVMDVEVALWRSEMVVQQQTVFVTERVTVSNPALPTAAFANESLRAGDAVTMLAGRDVSLSGLTRATDADGAVLIAAGRDVLLDG
ncbi:MAG TPA: hypothetical protein PLV92_25415, partial [Pirellulaceae bacterium]|nr:hypothetical protein [Pirellulaceae bacterium]